jgi:4'-phosphopantetheinyl transferase EntD
MVGSVTHTDGYGAAVAAGRQRLLSVGIDTERTDAIPAELWPRICAPRELLRLRTLAAKLQPSAATLIFAAKEAFCKCQFALVSEVQGAIDLVERGTVGRGDMTVSATVIGLLVPEDLARRE